MIHGIFYKNPQSIARHKNFENHSEDLVLTPSHQQIASMSSPNFWLAQTVEKSPSKNHSLTCIGEPARAIISAWARLDNPGELSEKLGISPQEFKSLSSSELILRAYLRFGETCTSHLSGDFCFAIYNFLEKRLFCARDQMGVKPFYYYHDQNIFAFSSSLKLFHHVPDIQIQPSMEWASKFLLSDSLVRDFEKTAYHNISILPPAHHLSITANTVSKKRYFSFHTNKIQLKTSQDYVDYYREHLDRAIKCRAQVDHPLGCELSGGIDSSTVAAYAIKYFSRPLSDFHTFGFAYFAEEPKYILRLSQHFRIPMTYICCNISLFNKSPERALKVLGVPAQHGNSVSHEIFYDLAESRGVRTLLSGFGGDEFVTSIHGYLYLHELLKNRKYFQLYQNLTGNPVMRGLRFLKFSYKHRGQRGVQNKAMAQTYAKRWPDHIVDNEMIQAYALKSLYDAKGVFDHGYHDLDQFTLEKRLAPFISTRTSECTLMAASYGVEYRWPLLDTRLIQCFLSIPTREKYHRGVGRYLHKRAIANVVPQEIVEQNSKFMGERLAKSIPKQYTLHEDLHPALANIINQSKLLKQEKHLKDIAARDISKLSEDAVQTIRRNIYRVNNLDHWLKYYFPKGCEWASEPSTAAIP